MRLYSGARITVITASGTGQLQRTKYAVDQCQKL